VKENGVTYDLNNDKDLLRYLYREIEHKENTYDLDDDQLVYNRRQIKYLFSSLIERKFDEKMKPTFETQI
jgi:hypothetical protein